MPAVLATIEALLGARSLPSDVRALLAAVDTDPELVQHFETRGVVFEVDPRTRERHEEVVILWNSAYDDAFVGLDEAGTLVEAFEPPEGA